jgi:hypothetical protein
VTPSDLRLNTLLLLVEMECALGLWRIRICLAFCILSEPSVPSTADGSIVLQTHGHSDSKRYSMEHTNLKMHCSFTYCACSGAAIAQSIPTGYGLDDRGVTQIESRWGQEVNKMWVYTVTPPCVFMAWCLIS